jgi:hypothetical protein
MKFTFSVNIKENLMITNVFVSPGHTLKMHIIKSCATFLIVVG